MDIHVSIRTFINTSQQFQLIRVYDWIWFSYFFLYCAILLSPPLFIHRVILTDSYINILKSRNWNSNIGIWSIIS